MTDANPYLTVGEFAEMFRISKQKVYQMIEGGDLPHLRTGGNGSGGIRILKSTAKWWENENFVGRRRIGAF